MWCLHECLLSYSSPLLRYFKLELRPQTDVLTVPSNLDLIIQVKGLELPVRLMPTLSICSSLNSLMLQQRNAESESVSAVLAKLVELNEEIEKAKALLQSKAQVTMFARNQDSMEQLLRESLLPRYAKLKQLYIPGRSSPSLSDVELKPLRAHQARWLLDNVAQHLPPPLELVHAAATSTLPDYLAVIASSSLRTPALSAEAFHALLSITTHSMKEKLLELNGLLGRVVCDCVPLLSEVSAAPD